MPDQLQLSTIEKLQQFGIPKIAAQIYLHLVSNPPLTIVEISKQLGLARTTVYDNVQHLVEVKLVERVEAYKSHKVKAYPIDTLYAQIEKQQTKVEQLEQAFQALKTSLNTVPNPSNLTEVRYYQGASGLEQMIWNTLKAKRDIVGYSTYGRREIVGAKFYKRFVEAFAKKKIQDKVIINPSKHTLEYIKQFVLPGSNHQQSHTPDVIRVLPKSNIHISGDTMIYNNTFAVAYWQSGEIVGFEIDNRAFVKTQRSIFSTLWKTAKPIIDLL